MAAGPSRPTPALPIARHNANASVIARRRSCPGAESDSPSRSTIWARSTRLIGRPRGMAADGPEKELLIAALVHLIGRDKKQHDQPDVDELGSPKPRLPERPEHDRENH